MHLKFDNESMIVVFKNNFACELYQQSHVTELHNEWNQTLQPTWILLTNQLVNLCCL